MSKAKRLANKKTIKTKETEINAGGEIQKDKSPYVFQDKKMDWELNIRNRHELKERQKEFFEIMTDKKTNVVFLKGRAGTSKTYLSVYAGLTLLNKKAVSDILYIRSPVEVGKSIGFIPGDFQSKIDPYLAPLRDKVEEFVSREEADRLTKEGRLVGTVPNFLRGASWNAKFVIVDEAQNMGAVEMITLISRIGHHSKIIFLFDETQSDIRGRVEVLRYFDLFNNPESESMGIYCKSFLKEDIVRNKILGYIMDVIEGTYTPPMKNLD
jgi:predicted ribonuclease YlaK